MKGNRYLLYVSYDYDTKRENGVASSGFYTRRYPPTIQDVQEMIEYFKKNHNAETIVIRNWMPLSED